MKKRHKAGVLCAAAALAALTITTTIGASPSAVPSGYKGIEAKLPTAYKVPAKRSGTSCTIGFQSPIAANETLSYWQRAVVAQGKAYGCRVITLDDALDPDKQVSNMEQLLAQNADVIIFYPLDPKATTPVLRKARSQGVPVLAVDASFGNTKAVPLITSQVWQGRDIQAYLQAQAMARAKKGAKLGLIGIGVPVPALKYLNKREAQWAKQFGLSVVGSRDNPSDDVTGGEKAANGLLQAYSDMDAVIGYNDPSALGAVVAARGAGRGPDDRRAQRLERRRLGREVGPDLRNGAGRSGRLGATARLRGVQPDHEAEPAAPEDHRPPGNGDHEGERRQGADLGEAGAGDPLTVRGRRLASAPASLPWPRPSPPALGSGGSPPASSAPGSSSRTCSPGSTRPTERSMRSLRATTKRRWPPPTRRTSARTGGDDRPLLGLPVTVKDSLATAGLRTASGSLARADHVPADDATVVARLRAAGAIVVAKTTVPEYTWAYETESALHGRTLNPHDPDRTCGGSSGGEAALLGADASVVGLGTDGGGLDPRAEPLLRHRRPSSDGRSRPGDGVLALDARHRHAGHQRRGADGALRRGPGAAATAARRSGRS